MLRFHNFDIVFAEFPDETTLAINLTGCPNRCPGCHSPHLQDDTGEPLDAATLQALLTRYGTMITCVGFMGGDGDPEAVDRLAAGVRQSHPQLRIGWYSGRSEVPAAIRPEHFDYLKLGPWIAGRGALSAPTTNQRFYRIRSDGSREDLTAHFQRRGPAAALPGK